MPKYEEPDWWEAARKKKREERRKLLEAEPDKKIRVDRAELYKILPFLHFYCVSDSSAIRDQAIHGSDIDGGVVIVAERHKTKELEFLEKLQEWGFIVVHGDDDQPSELQGKKIHFMTQEEFDLEKSKRGTTKVSANLQLTKEVGEYGERNKF